MKPGLLFSISIFILRWRGENCEEDIDECALNPTLCGPGVCRNLPGTYICSCEEGLCGDGCALPDPCASSPCAHGSCHQRCGAEARYVCSCPRGWGGHNCERPEGAQLGKGEEEEEEDEGLGWRVWAVGGAVALVAVAALALVLLAALRARRQRASRGTYSPSGQEYCNPRAEMAPQALKPPPEERLI